MKKPSSDINSSLHLQMSLEYKLLGQTFDLQRTERYHIIHLLIQLPSLRCTYHQFLSKHTHKRTEIHISGDFIVGFLNI